MELHDGAGPALEKDKILDALAEQHNVAQFVSFAPGAVPRQRYCRVQGLPPGNAFENTRAALEALLRRSAESSVNVRSFDPHSPRSREFVYGIKSVDDALAVVTRLAVSGLHTIANETIDVADGGVSGVAVGQVIEFAPDDTPRCVEKPGIAALPRPLGDAVLETVYGFSPSLPTTVGSRVEFSLHPLRRGWRHEHVVLWEMESYDGIYTAPVPSWPNRFSRFIGDKAYGLLIADSLGLPVPRTDVIPRRLAPFRFGRPTNSGERWIRTCPPEQQPGQFTTKRGWTDPFVLFANEDPGGQRIASVLSQDGVDAAFSGTAGVTVSGESLVEGVEGYGDRYMLGQMPPGLLPSPVQLAVRRTLRNASRLLGPVRIEWVFDSRIAWVVQLHVGAGAGLGDVLVAGDPVEWIEFDATEGLARLRQVLEGIDRRRQGVVLRGAGAGSHMGDLLRKAAVPSRVVRGN